MLESSPHQWHFYLRKYGLRIVGILFLLGGSSCINLSPSEEQLSIMAQEFVNSLDIQIENPRHDIYIIPFYDDEDPSSYIVSTYAISNTLEVAQQRLKQKLLSTNGWIVKNEGDRWFMQTIDMFTFFCARLQVDGEYHNTPVDNFVAINSNGELIIKLYYASPSRCKLAD